MLKSYKNGFLEIIDRKGLDRSIFDVREDQEDGVELFVIRITTAPLTFVVRTSPDNYRALDCRYSLFAPGYPGSEIWPDQDYTFIGKIYEKFEEWLEDVVKAHFEELSAPDLWAQIQQHSSLVEEATFQHDEAPFNADEKEKMRSGLEEFRTLVIEAYSPTAQQLSQIDHRLEYLTERLDNLNRIDWQGLALSTLISVSVALSLDTDQGRHLFALFGRVFSDLLRLLS